MTPQTWPLFTIIEPGRRVCAVVGWDERLDPVLAPLDGEGVTAGWSGSFRYFTSEEAARASLDHEH